ncbi:hypothetical protein AJ80_03260 [Polytolypa hystricis UAMH7299]|uniref:Elongation of fatty acids protein n=1 Tax=Polytolypa hystricis (strain UAMH7299) TaxID=1447883 RepID=A0A2B7YK84_POLH7|nr:hypothetical protein AJ80_03260 [Polytolypa hystricis UAMH7299]
MSASVARSDLPAIHFGLPPRSLIKFPPGPLPESLGAPFVDEPTWKQPFNIPLSLYNKLLEVHIPITIAVVYATTVIILNRVNKKRGYKPWAISKTLPFKLFVILHNVFLAVYSAWTFVGMINAFRESWPARSDNYYAVNLVDALCKVNGPRGLGNAAIYDTSNATWTLNNPEFTLSGPGNTPDPTDVGRLWNKGLAFFGWIFYLSKFYEVLDTAIILAKGKKSSTLQTYHHAGAMMCMWAGIRYMASPIWIFALVNSGIHALMYTYYTLTAVSVPIPIRIKRSLTTMQILQFVFGTALAAVHLFISYSLPASVPHNIALSPLDSNVAVDLNDTATGMGPWLKKLALRAAGAEGVAENVVNAEGKLFGADGAHAARAILSKQEVRYHLEPRTYTCMDTSGQAFAIWLNVLYLLPLTFLFARFFIRSYLRRTDAKRTKKDTHPVEHAGRDAIKGVTREIRNAVIEMGSTSSTSATDAESGISGSSTPLAEANVDDITAKKQQSSKPKPSEGSKSRHSPSPSKSPPISPSPSPSLQDTPEMVFETNIETNFNTTQRGANRQQPASVNMAHPIGTKEIIGTKGKNTPPRDLQAYEANIDQVMTSRQLNVDHDPENSSAPTKHEKGQLWSAMMESSSKKGGGIQSPFSPERGYEVCFDDMLNDQEKEAEEEME